jgi:hypothetical protein
VATIEEVMSRLETAGSQIPGLTAVKLLCKKPGLKDASFQVVEHKITALGIIAKVCRLLFVLCCFGAADNMGQKKKSQPPTPHVYIPDSAEVVLAEEFAAARTTNGKVFSWRTKPTDGSRGGLGCNRDPSTPGKVAIPGRVLQLINCCSFIIAKNEDCAWAFGSYSCGERIGLRNTSGKVVEQLVKIWQNPGEISSGDGIACMLDNGRRIFFGDRPDDKQMWEDG